MSALASSASVAGSYLLVGGDSLIGAEIARLLHAGSHPLEVTSRRSRPDAIPLDLARLDLTPLAGRKFRCAFLCAAVANMRACEEAPSEAWRINVDATLALMRHLAAEGTHVVYLSSAQVFEGETPKPAEDAPRAPKNAYGRQKLAVEQAIEREGFPAAIVRVTKVIARKPDGLFRAWLDNLGRGEPATAATNLTLAPVATEDVASAAIRLGSEQCLGAWHLSSIDELPYFDAARQMAAIRGLPQHLLRGEAVTEAQVPAIYRRRFAALDGRKFAQRFDAPLRSARDVLIRQFGGAPAVVAADSS
jgi:dTDP-4-dehydrorhamnose reductase